MPFADINGQRIHYEDTGGPGPALVLAHGLFMDLTMFEPQVAALAPDVRVIRWDERAHGRTGWDGKPFNYWDSAADMIGLLDHLGLERAIVGGMSQGGFLSLRAALARPERVAGLVLIDTQAGVDGADTLAHYRQLCDAWVAMGPQQMIVEVVLGLILGAPEHWEPWATYMRETSREKVQAASTCLLERDDITARLPEISCPAIVFHGTADLAIPMARAEEMARLLPRCERLVPVEGAAHAANLTHPDGVNPALRDFVQRHG
jgi:pimeloyl-ACP methyl ester carboxylesterase